MNRLATTTINLISEYGQAKHNKHVKMNGNELQSQEEAVCAHVIRPKQPLQ